MICNRYVFYRHPRDARLKGTCSLLFQYVLSSPKFVDFGGKSTKLWNKTFPGGYEQIYVKGDHKVVNGF